MRTIGTGNESCDWTIDQPRWFVLGVDGSVREAASGVELRDAWYGERAISFSCSNVAHAGARRRADGLIRTDECTHWPANILLEGELIGRAEMPVVLGFVEVE